MPSLTSAEQLQVGKRQMEFMGMWNKNGSDHLKKNVPKKNRGVVSLWSHFLTINGWALTK